MQRFLSAWITVGVIGLCSAANGEEEGKADSKAATDFTETAREMNSAKYAAPPTKFRTGNVKSRSLDSDKIRAEENGFRIDLPSSAPIPTPTVYRKKLYVSGGFHSKEFYCFDAASGEFVWGRDLDDDGPTSAVCDEGVTVFNTESCTIFALDADSGKLLWSHWLGDPLTSTPAIANGRVFTSYPARGGGGDVEGEAEDPFADDPPSQGNKKQPKPKRTKRKPAEEKPRPKEASHVLACLDLKTGKILWQRWIDSDVMSAPVAADNDELYATSFGGTVYKFKQSDGTILSAVKSRATSAPVVVGDDVYLTQRADNGKDRKAMERQAGLSRSSSGSKFAGSAKDAKYLDVAVQSRSSKKGSSMALDAANGFGGGAPAAANAQAAGANIGQDNVSSLQAFEGSRLLHMHGNNFSCMGDEFVCASPKDGKTLWKVKLQGDLEKEGGFLGSSPAAAGGMLFITTLKGEVLQIDPKQEKVVKTYSVKSPLGSQPVIADGRIYVGTQDGQLVCIDTGDLRFTGWAAWGGSAAHTGVAK